MAEDALVDADALRVQVRETYRQVAPEPETDFHFHTGRALAHRLGYEAAAVDGLPDRVVEVFAEIWRVLKSGGWLQFADIANGRPVPAAAARDIDLWTG